MFCLKSVMKCEVPNTETNFIVSLGSRWRVELVFCLPKYLAFFYGIFLALRIVGLESWLKHLLPVSSNLVKLLQLCASVYFYAKCG